MKHEEDKLKIGEWVKGESREGALIHGYIEAADTFKGTMNVTVVASDHDQLIGRTVRFLKKVERLPVSVSNKEEVMSLIDIALFTKDEKWFMELTEKLKTPEPSSSQASLTKSVLSVYEDKAKTVDQESKNEKS